MHITAASNMRFASAIFLGLIYCIACGSAHAAAIPSAITVCSTCTNQASLATAAQSYFQTWVNKTPPGYVGVVTPILTVQNGPNCGTGVGATTLLVISTNIPISATFYPCLEDGPHGSQHLATIPLSTATDAGAVANDINILARSVKMQPITLQAGEIIQGVDPVDLIGTWLQGRLVETNTGTSIWHAIITLNLSQVVFGTFTDPVTGQSFTIYSGEQITVYDANGWSVRLQWTPSVPGAPWQIVPGSVRDNHGNKVNMVNNTPTSPVKTAGSPEPLSPISGSGGVSWNPFVLTPWYGDTTPHGSVTVGDPIVAAGSGDDSLEVIQVD